MTCSLEFMQLVLPLLLTYDARERAALLLVDSILPSFLCSCACANFDRPPRLRPTTLRVHSYRNYRTRISLASLRLDCRRLHILRLFCLREYLSSRSVTSASKRQTKTKESSCNRSKSTPISPAARFCSALRGEHQPVLISVDNIGPLTSTRPSSDTLNQNTPFQLRQENQLGTVCNCLVTKITRHLSSTLAHVVHVSWRLFKKSLPSELALLKTTTFCLCDIRKLWHPVLLSCTILLGLKSHFAAEDFHQAAAAHAFHRFDWTFFPLLWQHTSQRSCTLPTFDIVQFHEAPFPGPRLKNPP